MTGMSVAVDLSGVPETLLWTLYHRAAEARRPDAVLRDPLAVELVERIDYPVRAALRRERMARALAGAARAALRHRDRALPRRAPRRDRRGARPRPGAPVLAGRRRPCEMGHRRAAETVEVAARLLPESPRRRTISGSALDFSWL